MAFDDLYQDVPSEQREALRTFRENYPQKRVHVDGVAWTYHVIGQGETTILWLVGGLKKADVAYKSIPLLANEHRIIAPDYPAVATMQELADGLGSMLDQENIEQVMMLAGSFGGMLAQIFVRAYRDRVSKLVLSTTTAPDDSQIERYRQLLEMAQAAPDALLAETAQSQMFGTIAPPDEEVDFYRAYLKELYEHRLTKVDIVTIYQAIIDYMERSFLPDDLTGWDGDLLIINSDNDATFGNDTQNALIALYPMATVHTFDGAGHSPASTQRKAFFERVSDFFAK